MNVDSYETNISNHTDSVFLMLTPQSASLICDALKLSLSADCPCIEDLSNADAVKHWRCVSPSFADTAYLGKLGWNREEIEIQGQENDEKVKIIEQLVRLIPGIAHG